MKAARIVVLTVALAAGGVAAILAGRSQNPVEVKQASKVATVDILVAKSNISMGQKVTPADMQWQAWPASASTGNFIRMTERPNALEQLSDNIARAPFAAGEPIREAKLVNAKGSGFMAAILPPGMRAISTQISAETSAGGFILPNDHVDVIVTRRVKVAAVNQAPGSTDGHTSETILRNVRVLAIDQNVQEKDGQKVVIGKIATLELASHQAEALTLAQQTGTLTLALRSMTDTTPDAIEPPKTNSDYVIVMTKGNQLLESDRGGGGGVNRETYTCNPECALLNGPSQTNSSPFQSAAKK